MNSPHLLDAKAARILPWIVAIAFFMQALDATILNTALPTMAQDLNVSPLRMQSSVIAYMLTVAILIPASGWLADRFGGRRVFIAAILLFSFGSLLCALSQSLGTLVASRIVQAAGGALMMPVGRLIILRNYPRDEFVKVMSLVTIPGLMGPLLGPAVGGWLVEYVSWHWIFLINLPVGALGCWAAWYFLPNIRHTEPARFDWLGFLLFSGSMLLLSLALEGMGTLEFSRAQMLLLLLFGISCMSAYWLHAANVANPLFSLELFKIHTFSVGLLGNLFTRLGTGALPFLTPLYLQLALGYSPSQAGLTMIPMALAAMGAKTIADRLLKHFGYRHVLLVNTLILGMMIAGFALFTPHTSAYWLYGYMALLGAFNSVQMTAMNTLTVIDLHGQAMSSGNSLVSVNMQLSMSLGIAVAAAVLGSFVDIHHAFEPEPLLRGFHLTYLCLGAATVLAAAIFLQIKPSTGKPIPMADALV